MVNEEVLSNITMRRALERLGFATVVLADEHEIAHRIEYLAEFVEMEKIRKEDLMRATGITSYNEKDAQKMVTIEPYEGVIYKTTLKRLNFVLEMAFTPIEHRPSAALHPDVLPHAQWNPSAFGRPCNWLDSMTDPSALFRIGPFMISQGDPSAFIIRPGWTLPADPSAPVIPAVHPYAQNNPSAVVLPCIFPKADKEAVKNATELSKIFKEEYDALFKKK